MFAPGNLSTVDLHSEVRNGHRLPKVGRGCAALRGRESPGQLVCCAGGGPSVQVQASVYSGCNQKQGAWREPDGLGVRGLQAGVRESQAVPLLESNFLCRP